MTLIFKKLQVEDIMSQKINDVFASSRPNRFLKLYLVSYINILQNHRNYKGDLFLHR
jgi:hypothetical protein